MKDGVTKGAVVGKFYAITAWTGKRLYHAGSQRPKGGAAEPRRLRSGRRDLSELLSAPRKYRGGRRQCAVGTA